MSDSFSVEPFKNGISLGIPSYSYTYTMYDAGPKNPLPGGGDVALIYEDLVRPWSASTPYADRILQRLIAKRPGALDGDAILRWGGPTNWSVRNAEYPTMTVSGGSDDAAIEEALDPPTLAFDEVAELREVETIRVTNPLDDSQYVDVDRITKITFKGPDLRPEEELGADGGQNKIRLPYIYYEYTLHHPAGTAPP